jgi:hypothetical protein
MSCSLYRLSGIILAFLQSFSGNAHRRSNFRATMLWSAASSRIRGCKTGSQIYPLPVCEPYAVGNALHLCTRTRTAQGQRGEPGLPSVGGVNYELALDLVRASATLYCAVKTGTYWTFMTSICRSLLRNSEHRGSPAKATTACDAIAKTAKTAIFFIRRS